MMKISQHQKSALEFMEKEINAEYFFSFFNQACIALKVLNSCENIFAALEQIK